jgi:hypothetical protein
VNFSSGQFGRITTLTGDPRIMQFGVKYGFEGNAMMRLRTFFVLHVFKPVGRITRTR